jgi:hypothetical protein
VQDPSAFPPQDPERGLLLNIMPMDSPKMAMAKISKPIIKSI